MKPKYSTWDEQELEAIVDGYLEMLVLELQGQAFVKLRHNRKLMERLPRRSLRSIESKHQNISAVLLEFGLPFVIGYKPLSNYQGRLADRVAAAIARHPDLLTLSGRYVEAPAQAHRVSNMLRCLTKAPKGGGLLRVTGASLASDSSLTARCDLIEREARNRSLGLAGERFVLEFEAARLQSEGANALARRVEWVSQTSGDGAGFDIRSFDSGGRQRLIEVKTTALGAETPVFVTRNELKVSKGHPEEYHLYRVFEFRRSPKLFIIPGRLDHAIDLTPTTYIGKFL